MAKKNKRAKSSKRANSPTRSYGSKKNKKLEQEKKSSLLNYLKRFGVLKSFGEEVFDPVALNRYVKAVTYGGYTFKDVLRDFNARSKGKEGNIHPSKKRGRYFKDEPERFGAIKGRPPLNMDKKRNQAFSSKTPEFLDRPGGSRPIEIPGQDGLEDIPGVPTDPTEDPSGETPPEGPYGYKGKDTFGDLPKRDANGLYSWILSDGTVYEQEGFSLGADETGWEYLGDHTSSEWSAAEALFKADPPPIPYENMTDIQKDEWLNQAHKEMSQNFMSAVLTDQEDLITQLGSALENYSLLMESEDKSLDDEIQQTIDVLEASGLTFQGQAKAELGDYYSAVGILTPEDKARIVQAMDQVSQQRGGQVNFGQEIQAVEMPRPEGVDDPTKSQAQKDALWAQYFTTPEWTQYQKQLETMAGQKQSPSTVGVSGSGQYGLGQQQNAFQGTRGFEGRVLSRNRLAQESSRAGFNQQVRGISVPFEQQIGSANLQNLRFPTIGGASILNPASNVSSNAQTGYTSNVYTRANQLGGQAAQQYSYTFKS